ncbi:MAG: amylo-alpha-1,6-glucosidase [Gemmatimonadaceae bacterium]|nr:amylo-alpha-1,6-glucosidase [Gloeobacterales cyanobacterium ES-bin-141]
MPAKVAVNTEQIVISDGSSFLVTARDGSIDDNRAQGFFVRDTRLISYYEISINRHSLQLLASSSITHRVAIYEFTNPELHTVNGTLPAGRLIITVRRDILGGMHEDIDITNHHSDRVNFQLMLAIRSDFADIFQVKAKQLLARGEVETTWQNKMLTTEYRNGTFQRGIIAAPDGSSTPPHYANGRLLFDVSLEPGKSWHTCLNFTALVDGEALEPKHTDAEITVTKAGQVMANFLDIATRLQSSNVGVMETYQQALTDMGALRIEVKDNEQTSWMPAAGIPWFVAVFGRDSIIASLQTMAVNHEFGRGTLVKLAQLQASEVDDWRDAQPGKILHELRQGELVQLHEFPHSPYYGTVEATILWIITLAEAYNWNADPSLLDDCRMPLERALAWIDRYGDFDGDGFVEYLTRSKDGIRNQGWKDSGDAIVYADGTQVEPPIALCEVQGYVYDAWQRAAPLYELWGETERAQELRQKAAALYQRFNDRFWMEEEGFYCLGLDSQKQQIRSITSNPGHLLWSGIVPPERARQMVQRLFQPDLWCGWGVRTLSAQNPAYNPISYQLGCVWPHDNSLIAAGLKRYGYDQEANRIAEATFAAATYFESGRMPELFAGIERRAESFPVPYPDASIPQAWAAGSIFFLIRTIVGLEADAPNRRLRVQPALPEWLPDLTLTNLAVGDAKVTLRFWRVGEQSHWEVTDLQGELNVYIDGND